MSAGRASAPAPERALAALAAELRGEGTVISPHVVEPSTGPSLGLLAARGPRAAEDPHLYALVVEAVREGYLLHYGEPRILAGSDGDLALLAGDYLYARGIERLAALGDEAAIRELSELIGLAAECHAEGRPELASPLWLASAVAVGCGSSERHETAKRAARALEATAAAQLAEAAAMTAAEAGIAGEFEHAAEAIDFRAPEVDVSG